MLKPQRVSSATLSALDHSVLAKGTEAQVLEMVKFEGKEQFEELCKTDKVIIVAPHFVGLDAGGIAMNTIVRGASLYQTQSNPVWDKWAFDARKRFSDPVLIPKSNSAMKEVIRALRAIFRIWTTVRATRFSSPSSVSKRRRFPWFRNWQS